MRQKVCFAISRYSAEDHLSWVSFAHFGGVTWAFGGCWNSASLRTGLWNIKMGVHHSSLNFRSQLSHLQGIREGKNEWKLNGKLPGCLCTHAVLGSLSQWEGLSFWHGSGLFITMSKHTPSQWDRWSFQCLNSWRIVSVTIWRFFLFAQHVWYPPIRN